jgi:hypothetical protein
VRDAVKQYVARSQFRALQAYGIQRSKKLRLKEEDVRRLKRGPRVTTFRLIRILTAREFIAVLAQESAG